MKNTTLLHLISITGIILLSLFSLNTKAQLTIDNTMTPSQLVQNVLVGGGVTVSNVTMTGGTAAMYGSFTNGSTTTIGLDAGVILCSGNTSSINQNASVDMGDENGQPGDADLDNISTNTTYDACVLEFDFVPLDDTLNFRYVFASEEYHDYVNSSFNDIFAFFVSGPNPGGGNYNNLNIALVPGTGQTVAINNVNNGYSAFACSSGPCNNCAYFVDNCNDNSNVFDAFTTVLTATVICIPCTTYHIKLAVADVGDEWLDSGVFLEANSFSTNGVTNNTTYTSSIDTLAVEGCNNAIIHFYLNSPATDTTVMQYTITGSAQNGIDFPAIPDSVIFLPGQDSTVIWVIPFNDGLNEPIETVYLVYTNIACGGTIDSIPVYIKDYTPIQSMDMTYASCSGLPVTLDLGVSGGYAPLTYNWTPGGATTETIIVSPTSSTNYALNVTDACGGSRTDTAFVFVSNLTSSISSSDSVTCFGLSNGSATVVPSDGLAPYTYSWSPSGGNAATATGLAAGVYIVSVTDSVGCTGVDTVEIFEPALLTAAISNVDSIACNGDNDGSVTVAAGGGTPGYTYEWNTIPIQTGVSATGLSGGVYTVTVTDDNGCTSTASASVYEPTVLTASIGSIVPVPCYGDSIGSLTVTAGGGTTAYSYQWNTVPVQTTNVASGLAAGTYTVTVTDANGCTNVQTENISQPPVLDVTVTDTDSVQCFGQQNGSITIAVTGGTGADTYSWNSTPPQTGMILVDVPIGTYTVTVTDVNGCTETASGTVYQPSQLAANITNIDSVLCYAQNNGSAEVAVTGGIPGYTYLWNTVPAQTSATASNLPAGTYTVTVTDENSCTVAQTAIVSQPADLVLGLQPNDEGCEGSCNGQVTTSLTGGIGPYTYLWTDGQTTQTIIGQCPGTYYLTVTDQNGCTEVNNAAVGTTTFIDAIFTATPNEGTVPLTVLFTFTGNGANTYDWNFGDGNSSTLANPQNTYTSNGTYTVTLIINSGAPNFCPDTFELTITADNPSFLIVPNVFTPNGDGSNDEFSFLFESIETFHCVIFNRWGNKVYEWDDITQGWNGTTNGGAESSDGVYYYIIEAKGLEGIIYEMHGSVTLLK